MGYPETEARFIHATNMNMATTIPKMGNKFKNAARNHPPKEFGNIRVPPPKTEDDQYFPSRASKCVGLPSVFPPRLTQSAVQAITCFGPMRG